jgi:hypothetical protein
MLGISFATKSRNRSFLTRSASASALSTSRLLDGCFGSSARKLECPFPLGENWTWGPGESEHLLDPTFAWPAAKPAMTTDSRFCAIYLR